MDKQDVNKNYKIICQKEIKLEIHDIQTILSI